MSVIIRLQNLPWSANALDIRQYFKGLSIPEGGVHIVGGEMGDAFIAFSTDEDARQAMMKDRGKLNEVQIRLLLSSRTEMQKVIETARQQSLLALQKAGAIPATVAATPLKSIQLSTPQPPVITANSLQNILGTQLGAAPSFQTYQQQAGITLIPSPDVKNEKTETKISSRRESNESMSARDRRRSTSRDRRRSRSRDRSERSSVRRRRERSRSRERDRDRKSGRQRSSRRSRSRDHSRDRTHNGSHSNRNSKDRDTGLNSRLTRERQRSTERINENKESGGNEVKSSVRSSWNIAPTNAYETAAGQSGHKNYALNSFATAAETSVRTNLSNAYTTSSSINDISSPKSTATATLPIFKNFSTTTSTTNNYSINLLSTPGTTTNSDTLKPAFALQNPYTAALRIISSNSNSQDSNSSSIFSTNTPQTSTVYPGVVLDKKPTTSATMQQSTIPGLAGASPQNTFAQQSPKQQTTTPQQQTTTPQQQTTAPQQQPVTQQPIAFANTNPYAQMYPNLFAQAAAAGTGIANTSRAQNSKTQDQKFSQRSSGASNDYKGSQKNNNEDDNDSSKSCSIKITNMCSSTTYSDLRKFFSGLFIPHNGIKMINDREGLRTGVAYIQFSRSSCVSKAIIRNNTFLKTKRVVLETVTDEEFQDAEDSYKPHRDNYNRFNRNDVYDNTNRGGYDNRFDNRNNSGQGRSDINNSDSNSMSQQFSSKLPQEPLSVLYIEEIPPMATEHDIMKMFSAFTIFDILLTVSPENRREFTAYVKFSREDEAKSALMEQSRHMIGHRKVRVRPAREADMEKAKEKLRLANEQLKKEEADSQQHLESNEDYRNVDNCEGNEEGVDDELTIMENNTHSSNSKNRGGNNHNEGPNNSDSQPLEDFKQFKEGPTDPRLRRQKTSRFSDNTSNETIPQEGGNENSSFSQNMDQFPNMPFNGPNMNQSYNTSSFPPVNNMEQNFIILKNCEYNTRINDVAQLMLSANLNLKHIEPLRNERQMPSGEFIVEFTNPLDATSALNRFNNTMFRNRNLRVRDITPQEIADRIGKPFMNYFPGGGGRSGAQTRGNFDLSGRGPPPNFRMNNGFMDGMDRSRFDNMNNRNRGGRIDDSGSPNFSSMMRGNGGGGGSGGGVGVGVGGGGGDDDDDDIGIGEENHDDNMNFSNDDMFMDDDANQDIIDCDNDNLDKSDYEEIDEVVSVSSNGQGGGDDNSSIPEKFNRSGCVLALENVPFKADLKDIIEFFGEFEVKPDDIIRRFNDDGSATGDARVAFSTPTLARAAFEAKRQHTIFNRTIFMSPL